MRLEYFQMIDAVDEVDVEKSRLVARSQIPANSPIFEGHFPGHPLMPGVLLIETMAQASGYLILSLNNFDQMPFLAGVKDGKLRSFVEPETAIEVTAELEHDGSGFAMTKASINVDGKTLCNSKLTFKTLPFPKDELRSEMLTQAQRIGIPAELMKK